jgi:NAD(P)-dependent dehydrogenase (short-subunit alcohol dehydrogenase family)
MKGKVCLITGANSGIGKVTAEGLARMGATVVMVCRNRLRGSIAMSEIMRKTSSNSVDLMIADLSSQSQIRRLAHKFQDRYQRLDALINNAGTIVFNLYTNRDGIEITFATNYLGHFLLTNLLLETLLASAPARVINISSIAHIFAKKIDFQHLKSTEGLSAVQTYTQSKLANLMFTYELSRRLDGTGVTVNAIDPGIIRTNLGNQSTGFIKVIRWFVVKVLGAPPENTARNISYLASSPEVEGVTGRYFFKRKPKRSSRASYDQQAWLRLWEISEELTGLSKDQRLKRAVYRDASVQLTERSGV